MNLVTSFSVSFPLRPWSSNQTTVHSPYVNIDLYLWLFLFPSKMNTRRTFQVLATGNISLPYPVVLSQSGDIVLHCPLLRSAQIYAGSWINQTWVFCFPIQLTEGNFLWDASCALEREINTAGGGTMGAWVISLCIFLVPSGPVKPHVIQTTSVWWWSATVCTQFHGLVGQTIPNSWWAVHIAW